MKLDFIIFLAIITIAFLTNFWFGMCILILNLSAFMTYLDQQYIIKWDNYFKIHAMLFCVYFVGKFISFSIYLLIKNE